MKYMQLETFDYKKESGWSIDSFPKLDSQNTLVLAFCAPEFFDNTQPLKELNSAYPNSFFAGCSTAGEIYKNTVSDNSISVAVLKFDKSNIDIATMSINAAEESFSIGNKLANKLNKKNLKSILVLSDGINVNGSALVEGLKKDLAQDIIITGGLAGDGSHFKKTWILNDEKPTSHNITAIGLYGEHLEVGFGSKGGWDIFGPERLITKSKGNVLYEIDGQPALALYKKYLGDMAKDLPSSGLLFPLAISVQPLSDKQVVRTILAVDEDKQTITFAGDMPQGWYAQLMRANSESLIEGASIAGKMAKSHISAPKTCLGIAISCVGRRLVLGERAEEEVEASLDMLGNNSKLIGFYSYGEISPNGLGASNFHNQTMTLTTISEN